MPIAAIDVSRETDTEIERRTTCILVVDDDPLSRTLLARLLGLMGYRARVAEQATDAIEIALSGTVDGLLLDLGMPEVDGFTLLAQLRRRESQSGRAPLPAIAVTGYAASLDRVRSLMAGFSEHLAKPIEAAKLQAALTQHLPPHALPRAPDSDALRVEAAARRLAQVRPADTRMAPTVLEAFAMRSGQLIEAIVQAHDQGDRAAVDRAVLSLRASAEFMGATHLARLCGRLQADLESADDGAATALVASLADEHQAVLALLLRGARHALER